MSLRLLPRSALGARLDELQRVAHELFGDGVTFSASTLPAYQRPGETPQVAYIEVAVTIALAEPFPRLNIEPALRGGAASAGEDSRASSSAPELEGTLAAPSLVVIPTALQGSSGVPSSSPWSTAQRAAAQLVLQAGQVVDLDAACAVMAQFAGNFNAPTTGKITDDEDEVCACPVDDPDCMGDAEDCHDACEAPDAAPPEHIADASKMVPVPSAAFDAAVSDLLAAQRTIERSPGLSVHRAKLLTKTEIILILAKHFDVVPLETPP